ncbi:MULTISPECIES: Flp family type IVb pilin [unclassified Mesorhizobium]|jgi:pilus assembly protein Flp/PilA|uniref:Flp family type IVb pilin n=1 Tax=unclassified Mesorhizobium TaxID=325217 RepID=UPI0008EC2DC8|nr:MULTISPECIES: Flp family type IVb pilin [unclassified Mesorhizobium]RJG47083.1 Flp family type IVb pilin [Mesorhizobium sp. DCY119]SFT49749.1 pilus assembly protein Flp/PilA [Mesorhizobium sp. YR577]
MRQLFQRFFRDESGATVIEYAVIVTVLSLVIVGGVGQASNALQYLFSSTDSELVKVLGK